MNRSLERFDHRVVAARAVERRRGLRFRAFAAPRWRPAAAPARSGSRATARSACAARSSYSKRSHARRRGRRRARSTRATVHRSLAVEAAIAEPQRRAVDHRRGARAAALARRAAHFEDVGEVGVDVEGERHAHRLAAVVPQPDAARATSPSHRNRARNRWTISRGEHAIAVAERNVGVRQVGAEQLVVVLDARAQQQRPLAVQPQAEPRQVPRALVIQPLLARPNAPTSPTVVEHAQRCRRASGPPSARRLSRRSPECRTDPGPGSRLPFRPPVCRGRIGHARSARR